jgi:hypothetical protein
MANKKLVGAFVGVFIGILAVYVLIAVASAGYRFGQFLAQ